MRPACPLLRAILLVVACAVCLAPFHFRTASANDNKKNKKELKAQAEALLAKSRDLSNIEAPGSPAFALNAKIHYQAGTQTAEGDGQIIWMAPDHYREAFSAPNYFYMEIVRDGYRYLARTNDDMPLIIFELRNSFAIAMRIPSDPKLKIKDVRTTAEAEGAQTCMKDGTFLTECLDNEGDILSLEKNFGREASAMDEHYEFSSFVQFGTKRVPQKITFQGGNDHSIDVDVQQLAFINAVPADAFNIPIHSARNTWCAEPKSDPKSPVNVNPPDSYLAASQALARAEASLYCIIMPSGRVRSALLFHASGTVKQKTVDDWVANARFAPLLCGSDGQEYQVKVSFARFR